MASAHKHGIKPFSLKQSQRPSLLDSFLISGNLKNQYILSQHYNYFTIMAIKSMFPPSSVKPMSQYSSVTNLGPRKTGVGPFHGAQVAVRLRLLISLVV